MREEMPTAEASFVTSEATEEESLGEGEHGESEEARAPDDGEKEGDAFEEYRRRASEDMDEIRRLRPEYRETGKLSDLPIAVPFALFRGMGYGVEEALAFAEGGAARLGGKSHQRPVATRRHGAVGTGMSYRELADCRELFGNGLSDGEIRELYQRVTR